MWDNSRAQNCRGSRATNPASPNPATSRTDSCWCIFAWWVWRNEIHMWSEKQKTSYDILLRTTFAVSVHKNFGFNWYLLFDKLITYAKLSNKKKKKRPLRPSKITRNIPKPIFIPCNLQMLSENSVDKIDSHFKLNIIQINTKLYYFCNF